MERTWTTVGEPFYADDNDHRLEDGRTPNREIVEAAIEALEFGPVPERVAAMPGMAINEAIRQLRIPKVSAIAISSELAPFGLYGIEGNYRNGRARVYLVDMGVDVSPVASDFWASESEPVS